MISYDNLFDDIDDYEQALEAFDAFTELYLFNELNGKSAEFTEYDHIVDEPTFDAYYDKLMESVIETFDRGGRTDSANALPRVRIKSWVQTLEKRFANSIDKDKASPKKAGKIIEFYASIENAEADYNAISKLVNSVRKALGNLENYKSIKYNSNANMSNYAISMMPLLKEMDAVCAQVSNTPSRQTTPRRMDKPHKVKVVKLDRSQIYRKTVYQLRAETPKFITLLNKYASLMDTMTALTTEAKKASKYDNKMSKSDYKKFKKDMREGNKTFRAKSELKYSRKATKNVTKEITSITRYLKLIMALEMEKLESLTALYLKINKMI